MIPSNAINAVTPKHNLIIYKLRWVEKIGGIKMKKPKNLGEVKEGKFTGYELKTGYLLILKHDLMGTFPALIAENNELFVCTDKQLLEKVWEKLPKRPARVIELQLYANSDEGIGFDVRIGDEAQPIGILSEEEFHALVKDKKDAFKWAPGLISLKKEARVSSPFV
jgi:hypothetical protein